MVDKASASENVVAATGNTFLDTLIIGHKWNDDHAVTFYFDDGTEPEDIWLDAAKEAFRNAFAIYETYIDLEFEEVDNAADANFVLVMNTLDEIEATAKFGYPDESDDQAFGQFPYDWSRWTAWHLQVGGYAFETVLHELGHGLGLGHPHADSGLNGVPFPGVENNGDAGDDGQNTGVYTVMSYLDIDQFWSPMPAGSDYGWGLIASPMAFDVAALQHIYGANPTTNAGNTTYTLPIFNGDGANTYWQTIWDTGGTDMIRHAGEVAAVIDLRAAPLTGPNAGGYLSRVGFIAGGFTIANGVTIEYAEGGSGDDTITGNGIGNEIAGRGGNDMIAGLAGADLIDGGGGNDSINGGSGDDTMVGGGGNDSFFIDSLLDMLHEGPGGGTDTVISIFTYTLGINFENLQLAESSINGIDGFGNSAANQIIGNSDANVLEGRAGDDFANGGAGDDSIDGGTGEDTLFGSDGDDSLDGGDDAGVILFAAAPGRGRPGGFTTVPDPDGTIDDFLNDQRGSRAPAGYNDELHGGNGEDSLAGRGGDDALFGDAGDDQLLGANGADWLDGGSGRDVMSGGAENDIYVVDSEFDAVIEGAGQGIDGVFSSINYVLGTNVENLALTGGATNHISGTGNTLANWITGNAASNIIDGLGASDLLLGLGGNDFIDGGTASDTIFGGEGNDVLDGGSDGIVIGPGPIIIAPGLAAADTLYGGNGNDTVYGRGGGDLLQGDAGEDELYGEDGADAATGGVGNDTVSGGGGGDSLLGDEGDDSLLGGSGQDRLNGGLGNDTIDGGTGGDTMIGGAGDDLFAVDAANDLVLEGLALGNDGVFSSISYTLGANVENLLLVPSAIPDIDGTGNALANLIIGNADANALEGRDGDDLLLGLAGNDDLDGEDGNDTAEGGDGDDDLHGRDGDDSLAGGAGDDDLRGNGDADTLRGGGDDDTLRGQAGDDVLDGESGDDRLIGGGGGDRFDFSGAFGEDEITDFDPDEGDSLRISGFGGGLDTFAELQPFVSIAGNDTTIDLSAFGGGLILLDHFVGLQALDVEVFA